MIVLKSAQKQILAALQSVSDMVERRHRMPILDNLHVLDNVRGQCSITSGMPSGSVGAVDACDDAGAESVGAAPEAAGDGDDDGGDGDGEPAPRSPSKPLKRLRKAKNCAPLPSASAHNTQATSAAPQNPPPALIWKLPEVLRNMPVSRATWYAGVKDGRYPQPVKIGVRAVGWRASDIVALTESGV